MKTWKVSTGLRLAFLIAVTTTALLLAFNVIMTRQTHDAFGETVQRYKLLDLPGRGLIVTPDESKSDRTPNEYFTNRFQRTLVWVTVSGILISLLLGFLIAQELIIQPLKRLQRAIHDLKRRNFKSELEPTGVPEFDQLVTEFNELARELDRAEELRQNLISDTSHELKTPLTAMNVQLEGMRDGLIPLEPKRIELLIKQVDRLTDLTDRLHDYSRLRNKSVSPDKKEVLFGEFMARIKSEYSARLSKAGMALELKIEPDFTLRADADLLEQVMVNLLENSLHYSGATTITISASNGKIRFSDNGKGVSESALPNLFERFYRVEQSRHRSGGGLGLGLAIVREIVEAHGWHIRAESANPGLEFVITT